jgi:hypothetical protein
VRVEGDELKRLVEQLPDEGVPSVLAEARRQARPTGVARVVVVGASLTTVREPASGSRATRRW